MVLLPKINLNSHTRMSKFRYIKQNNLLLQTEIITGFTYSFDNESWGYDKNILIYMYVFIHKHQLTLFAYLMIVHTHRPYWCVNLNCLSQQMLNTCIYSTDSIQALPTCTWGVLFILLTYLTAYSQDNFHFT